MSSGKPRQSRRTQRSSHRRSTNIRDPGTSSPTRMRRVHPEESSRNSQDRRSSRGQRRSDDQNPPDEQEQNDPPDQSSGSSDPRSRRRRTRSAQGSSDGQSWPVNADGEPRSPFARKMDQDIARQCFGASSEQDIRQQTPYERRPTREDIPPQSSILRPSTAGARPRSRSNSEAVRHAGSRAAEYDSEAVPSQRPAQLRRDVSKEFGQPDSEDVERNKKLDESELTSKTHRFPRDWFLCNLALLILMALSIAIGVWIAILNKKNGVFAKKRSNYV